MPHTRRALAASLIALTLMSARGRPARAGDDICDPLHRDCAVDPRVLQWRVLTHDGKFHSV